MNKPVYLGLSILEISKILMYEFWYDYVKPKYDEKAKLCYMDTDMYPYNMYLCFFIMFFFHLLFSFPLTPISIIYCLNYTSLLLHLVTNMFCHIFFFHILFSLSLR